MGFTFKVRKLLHIGVYGFRTFNRCLYIEHGLDFRGIISVYMEPC